MIFQGISKKDILEAGFNYGVTYQEFGVTTDWQLPRKQHLPTPWANLDSHLGIGKVQFGILSSKYNWQEYGSNCILHKSGWQPFTGRNLSCSWAHTKQSPLESPSIVHQSCSVRQVFTAVTANWQTYLCTCTNAQSQVAKELPGQNKEALSEFRHIGGNRAHLLEFPAVPIISGATIPLGRKQSSLKGKLWV